MIQQTAKYFDDKSSPSFSFIICEPGKVDLVIEKLQTLKTVKEIHRTYGKYDILVKLENMTEPELQELIHDQVQDMVVVHSVMNLTSVYAV
ncbi:MAG: Lrp/AsnC ligand binding domain-containing protein [Thaumarchaeota archaeon]|nr:Lrp/AsnC ligand binding domain-containing protein [Nitrososphaerota archaeon]